MTEVTWKGSFRTWPTPAEPSPATGALGRLGGSHFSLLLFARRLLASQQTCIYSLTADTPVWRPLRSARRASGRPGRPWRGRAASHPSGLDSPRALESPARKRSTGQWGPREEAWAASLTLCLSKLDSKPPRDANGSWVNATLWLVPPASHPPRAAGNTALNKKAKWMTSKAGLSLTSIKQAKRTGGDEERKAGKQGPRAEAGGWGCL